MKGKRWNKIELEILERGYYDWTKEKLLAVLPGRSWSSIRDKACNCNLHRSKIFISQKGPNNPMFGRCGPDHPMYGMCGPDHPWYGKQHTPESNRKRSESLKGKFCGPNSWNWKGGISAEPYCFDWNFKEFKEMIKERDGYHCQNPMCNGKSRALTRHHIDYNKKNCDPSNLITLCKSCNSKANFDREWHTAFYNAIIIGGV